MSAERARILGVVGAFRSFATAVAPRKMGLGPVYAIPKALKIAGLTMDQIDVIELNEAFAAQALAVIKVAGLDPARINVNGGAIALGHPLGCTGAKLTATILRELDRRQGRYGMVTMCIGGGMGAALESSSASPGDAGCSIEKIVRQRNHGRQSESGHDDN